MLQFCDSLGYFLCVCFEWVKLNLSLHIFMKTDHTQGKDNMNLKMNGNITNSLT